MEITLDKEAFPDAKPGDTIEVLGEAVVSDTGDTFILKTIEGVPIPSDNDDDSPDEETEEESETEISDEETEEESETEISDGEGDSTTVSETDIGSGPLNIAEAMNSFK